MVLINLISIRLAEHILEILGRASQNIRILKVLNDSRHQLDRLIDMRTAEVHIVINNGSRLMCLVEQLLYLVAQHRCNGKIRTNHDDIVSRHVGHIHIQSLTGIIFIEDIFGIIVFIQKSQRYRRFSFREYIYIRRIYSIVPHVSQNHLSYTVVSRFTDKSNILPHSSQRDHGIIHRTTRHSSFRLSVAEKNVENRFSNTDNLSHKSLLIYYLLNARERSPR